ncbi:MAG: 23S rRNA (guanosine(2251)-2'-O)-methyltransferase RlmB [Gammaproteobacteria bacterium]
MASADLVYGIHSVRALLEHSPDAVLEMWVQAGISNPTLTPILKLAAAQGLHPQSAPRATLDKMTVGGRHQGIVVRARTQRTDKSVDLKSLLEADQRGALYLILDGIEDPQNLGACLRVADAAGARAVIRPLHRGTGMTAAAAKAASGAAETVPLVSVNNLARALEQMKEAGVWLVGANGEANKTLYELDLTGPVAWVMGAEGEGMRRLTREHCDFLARIPMAGSVESLNVSVATGICLFETLRQRTIKR